MTRSSSASPRGAALREAGGAEAGAASPLPAAARRRRRLLLLLLTPPTLFLAVFFLAPLATMLLYSWLEPGLYGGVEWRFYSQNFGRIFGWADGLYEEFDAVYLEIFLRSAWLAFRTALLCLVVCLPMAFWVAQLSPRWKAFCLFLITLPFFASLIVRLFAWILLLRPTGFLSQAVIALGLSDEPIDVIYTETAVIIGMTYIFVPFMFLPLYASVEKLDRSLLEASRDLGATPMQSFRRVVLPLIAPGVIGGSILVFIPSLGNFVVPSLLGGAKVVMIGNLIEQQFLSARNWPFGAALGMTVMAAVLLLLLVYVRLAAGQDERETAKGGAS